VSAIDPGPLDLEVPEFPVELLEFLTDDELGSLLTALGVAAETEGGWSLQARQQTAEDRCDELMARGQTFELLYGGAGGGGKSEWLLFHLHRMALKYPGFSGLLIRRTYKELERTAIMRSMARYDRAHCRYNATNKRWLFDNGSVIEFGYCESDQDVFQYDSAEYDCVAWDELTQFPTDYPYRYLFSRLRTSTAKAVRGLVPHVIAGTNPHRTGVAWVKPRFVDIGEWETIHDIITDFDDGDSRTVARVFIPAKMTDNRFLQRGQYLEALSLLDDATRRAIEDGSWDVVEGQFFNEWDRSLHVVKAFTPPGWWPRISGYDFGIANPAAHEWIAVGPDGELYVYREMYRKELTPKEQAQLILRSEATGERVDFRLADPSIWMRTGAGPPIAAQFAENGVVMRRANNARIDGWARLRDYLRPSRRVEGEDGKVKLLPSLFIMDNCIDLIRTLPLLVHDRKNPEDVDTEGEDHAPDALRYGVMSRPRRSSAPVEPEVNDLRRGLVPKRRATSGDVFDHPTLGRVDFR
jgi:hypothetical protein